MLSRKKSEIKLLDIDPFELARQLTIMESEIFLGIQESEWIVPHKDRPDDNIKAAFTMVNRVCFLSMFSTSNLMNYTDNQLGHGYYSQ